MPKGIFPDGAVVKEATAEWVSKVIGPDIRTQLKDEESIQLVQNKVTSVVLTINGLVERDGLTWRSVPPMLGASIRAIMETVETLKNLNGADKRSLVTLVIIDLVRLIDRGKDGSLRRLKLPWVPGFIDRWVKDRILPLLIHVAVESVVSSWNRGKGALNSM